MLGVRTHTRANIVYCARARAFWPPQIKLVIYLFGWAQLARARSILMHCMFCGSRRVSRCWVFFRGWVRGEVGEAEGARAPNLLLSLTYGRRAADKFGSAAASRQPPAPIVKASSERQEIKRSLWLRRRQNGPPSRSGAVRKAFVKWTN